MPAMSAVALIWASIFFFVIWSECVKTKQRLAAFLSRGMFFVNTYSLPTLKFKILAIFYFRRKRAEPILFSSWLFHAWDHLHGLFPRKVSSCLICFGDFCLVFRILLSHVILCEAAHDLLPDKMYLPFLCIFWNFIYFCSRLYQNDVFFF